MTFSNNEFYHIYNRGVDKRKIFLRNGHYLHFIETIRRILTTSSATPRFSKTLMTKETSFNKIDIICYCLMPNHYHLFIRQNEDNGITEFMHKLNTSYTKYFNISNKRTGRLFEYTFKAVHIESENQVIHTSRYIHLNPLIADLVFDLKKYKWSSYLDYIGKRNDGFCQKEEILDLFGREDQAGKYEQFVMDQESYQRELNRIKNMLLE